MFKKLCFHWFGNLLNMGHVVEIPEDHVNNITGGNWVWLEEEEKHLAEYRFRNAIRDTPIGRWLRQHRPHHIELNLHVDWGNRDIMEWYQYPRFRAELARVRFFHAADAVSFKLAFL